MNIFKGCNIDPKLKPTSSKNPHFNRSFVNSILPFTFNLPSL